MIGSAAVLSLALGMERIPPSFSLPIEIQKNYPRYGPQALAFAIITGRLKSPPRLLPPLPAWRQAGTDRCQSDSGEIVREFLQSLAAFELIQ